LLSAIGYLLITVRVIAGEAKGHHLKAPRGLATRPTADKIRGAIFAMVESLLDLEGARVLDLYAGSGALGIEALSRGAAWADLVEASAGCCRLIAENLAHTKLAELARVHCRPVEQALWTFPGKYDLILLDPPYADPGLPGLLERLAGSALLQPGALVVAEHSKRTPLAASYGRLVRLKERRHGDTVVSIYRLTNDAEAIRESPVEGGVK